MRILTTTLALLGLTAVLAAGMPRFTSYEKAAAAARDQERGIFIEFTGTGWCNFCQDMRVELFELEAFREWMAEEYVWLEVDIVHDQNRKRSLPPEQLAEHTTLRGRYPVSTFPTLYLCDAAGRPFARKVGFDPKGSTEEYFFHLAQLGEKREARDEALAKARTATGEARLDALETALGVVPQDCVTRFYEDQYRELREARPDSPLVVAIGRDREMRELESKLGALLREKKFEPALAQADEILSGGAYEGLERQPFLLIRARALAGLEKKEEAAAVIREVLTLGPSTPHAAWAQRLMRSLQNPNPHSPDPAPPGFELQGPTRPARSLEPTKSVMEPLPMESEDLDQHSFLVLKSYLGRARGALARVRAQLDEEHAKWEELYLKQQALSEEHGPGHHGIAEYDRIITGLKDRHEKTHARERELTRFIARLQVKTREKYDLEEAQREADKLLEDARKLRDEAGKRLEEKL